MSVRKFRYDGLEHCRSGDMVLLDRGEETHLFRILRARPGEKAELLDGKGHIADAEVAEQKQLRILAVRQLPVPEKRIHLYIAPPRRQKMDAVLRAACELGVWRIVPVLCRFSVSEPGENSVEGRWTETLFESCKQSGNPYLPQCVQPMSFSDALRDAERSCSVCFYGAVMPPGDVPVIPDSGDLGWFVGPEGGFSDEELQKLAEKACPLKLGNWILRVETAAIAGIAGLL